MTDTLMTDSKQNLIETALTDLKECLLYCREQNGLDECKNCSLSEEIIEKVRGAFASIYKQGRHDGFKEMKKKALDILR